MGGLKPDLISDFPGMEMTSSFRCHEFSGRVMGGQGFISGFIESGQMFL